MAMQKGERTTLGGQGDNVSICGRAGMCLSLEGSVEVGKDRNAFSILCRAGRFADPF